MMRKLVIASAKDQERMAIDYIVSSLVSVQQSRVVVLICQNQEKAQEMIQSTRTQIKCRSIEEDNKIMVRRGEFYNLAYVFDQTQPLRPWHAGHYNSMDILVLTDTLDIIYEMELDKMEDCRVIGFSETPTLEESGTIWIGDDGLQIETPSVQDFFTTVYPLDTMRVLHRELGIDLARALQTYL